LIGSSFFSSVPAGSSAGPLTAYRFVRIRGSDHPAETEDDDGAGMNHHLANVLRVGFLIIEMMQLQRYFFPR
jgi:hypothetical protein